MTFRIRARVVDRTSFVVTQVQHNVQAILRIVGRDTKRYLQQIMPYASSSAIPNAAPHAHRGGLRKHIIVDVVPKRLRISIQQYPQWAEKWYKTTVRRKYKSGKVTPIRVLQRIRPIAVAVNVPGLLERGGVSARSRRYPSGRIYNRRLKYARFPYMLPARKFAVELANDLWKQLNK